MNSMIIMMRLSAIVIVLLTGRLVFGQQLCPAGEVALVLEIFTDAYGYETYWDIAAADGTVYAARPYNTYANRTRYRENLCVPAQTCLRFTIRDYFGDGIDPPGYYLLLTNGDTLAQGGNFTHAQTTHIFCQAGEVCPLALSVMEGAHVAPKRNTWYTFVPETSGMYRISTCEQTNCNTTIWVYDRCEGIPIVADNRGTIAYNDNADRCAPQSELSLYLQAGEPIFIRIGDQEKDCNHAIPWTLTFDGEVQGCTYRNACNFNPLATIEDSSCLPQGHPACPAGPDLRIREDSLRLSLRLDTLHATDACLIDEGCLRGYGVRDILRFTTHIENIGERDYYIGRPTANNPRFSWDNCHQHFHYHSYAEYLLFRDDSTEIPIGFKNGFCVTDLGCQTGNTPKYSCDNMGITAGCYDTYWATLECQWIDLTDLPDGRYVFVVRINWRNEPDALGQVEKDTANNWAQVCLSLSRSTGKLQVGLDEPCMPYTDCLGKTYGTARFDCAGVCNGTAIRGDLDDNGIADMQDAQQYIVRMLGNDVQVEPCTDLNADGQITVYDALLLANCVNFGATHPHPDGSAHDHCLFPAGVSNPFDTVSLQILEVNWAERYVDIGIHNPFSKVVAWQFQISGIAASHAESLVDVQRYPVKPYVGMHNGTIVGISFQDSTIQKSPTVQPLCRVYFFSAEPEDSICITEIQDVVNQHHERVVTRIRSNCAQAPIVNSTVSLSTPSIVAAWPNPASEAVTLYLPSATQESFLLEISDIRGNVHLRLPDIRDKHITIRRSQLPTAGLYFFRLRHENGIFTGKILFQ